MAKKNYSRQQGQKPLALRIFIIVVAAIMVLGVIASGIASLFV